MSRPAFLACLLFCTAACSGSLDVGTTGGNPGPDPGKGAAVAETGATATTCKPLGPEPVLLHAPQARAEILRPLSDGSNLWFITQGESGLQQGGSGMLTSVSLATKNATKHDLDGYGGGLYTLFGNEIAFVRTATKGASSLVLRDRDSGIERVLENPGGAGHVAALRSHASGVYWSSRPADTSGPTSISRFAAEQKELATLGNHSSLVTDGQRLFFTQFIERSTAVEIRAVSVEGGSAPTTFLAGFDSRNEFVQVFAADDNELFYAVSRLESGGTLREGEIRATTKDGRVTRTIAVGQSFGGISDLPVVRDAEHLTWVDAEAQADILRVKHAPGTHAVERIVGTEATRYVRGVTTDACNVFWTVVNPPAVYGRSRLP